jgi:hypothetical protein
MLHTSLRREERQMQQQEQPRWKEQPRWQPTRRQVLWTLGIVTVIAGGGLWFNRQQRERELETAREQQEREVEIAERRTQDEALQAYLDQMGQLLLDKDRPLRQSTEGAEVRTLARARTLTLLSRLDRAGKRSAVQFLYESGLVDKEQRVVDLVGADLIRADLSGAILSGAILSGAILSGAILSEARLSEATLRGAHVDEADLSGANLSYADLSYANLSQAKGVTNEELERQAKSLEGATMPNGQKYEDWFKDREKRQQDEERNGWVQRTQDRW